MIAEHLEISNLAKFLLMNRETGSLLRPLFLRWTYEIGQDPRSHMHWFEDRDTPLMEAAYWGVR